MKSNIVGEHDFENVNLKRMYNQYTLESTYKYTNINPGYSFTSTVVAQGHDTLLQDT